MQETETSGLEGTEETHAPLTESDRRTEETWRAQEKAKKKSKKVDIAEVYAQAKLRRAARDKSR